jgi:pyruvate ferredoxin oxidoreductase gamma subunit/2-oxoisovalerate ferredoxin oxidoreductase gamma subunit
MKEIRIHGRGGQGCVTAGLIIAEALFESGKWAQTFPIFGVERRGAPVAAFVRVGDDPILQRYNVYKPDEIIVLDPTLMDIVDVTAGLKDFGEILINGSDKDVLSHDIKRKYFTTIVDANRIALKWELGNEQAPIVNTAVVGAYLRTQAVKLELGIAAVRKHVPIKIEANVGALTDGYHYDINEYGVEYARDHFQDKPGHDVE